VNEVKIMGYFYNYWWKNNFYSN